MISRRQCPVLHEPPDLQAHRHLSTGAGASRPCPGEFNRPWTWRQGERDLPVPHEIHFFPQRHEAGVRDPRKDLHEHRDESGPSSSLRTSISYGQGVPAPLDRAYASTRADPGHILQTSCSRRSEGAEERGYPSGMRPVPRDTRAEYQTAGPLQQDPGEGLPDNEERY